MGNGFPGLAIVSVIALLVVLAAAISLHPWTPDSAEPHVSVGPGFGAGLDGGVALGPARRLDAPPVRLAELGGGRLAVAGAGGDASARRSRAGLAEAQLVAVPHPGSASQPPPSEPAPQPVPATEPVATPVSTPLPTASPESGATLPTRAAPGHVGPAGPGTAGGPAPSESFVSAPVRVDEGGEYSFGFFFRPQPTAYRAPGQDNLIARIYDEASGEHSLGLQLWDDGGGTQRGLWASGDATGGERFLAPLADGVWHQIVVSFEVSSEDEGLYLVLLDGEPVDAVAWVSLIDPASGYGLFEAGLFRDGERVDDAPDVAFEPARIGATLESVIP